MFLYSRWQGEDIFLLGNSCYELWSCVKASKNFFRESTMDFKIETPSLQRSFRICSMIFFIANLLNLKYKII